MDNVTLSKEQLYQLIGFIKKRGFHEPLVIVEILDHFACKVEEKIKADPALSLEQAMVSAHHDFGVLGFQPISKTFEADVKKKYKGIYRQEMIKVLMSPIHILIVACSSLLFYRGFLWAETNGYKHIFDINDVGVLAYLCIMVLLPLILFSKYRRKGSPVIKAIYSRAFWSFLLIISVSFRPDTDHLNARQLLFTSVIGTAGVCFAMIALFTIQGAMKIGYNNTEVVYDYLKNVEQ